MGCGLSFDATDTMQRTLFHEWLIRQAQGIVPQTMDWQTQHQQNREQL